MEEFFLYYYSEGYIDKRLYINVNINCVNLRMRGPKPLILHINEVTLVVLRLITYNKDRTISIICGMSSFVQLQKSVRYYASSYHEIYFDL